MSTTRSEDVRRLVTALLKANGESAPSAFEWQHFYARNRHGEEAIAAEDIEADIRAYRFNRQAEANWSTGGPASERSTGPDLEPQSVDLRGPSWWASHSEEQWGNWQHLQRAALTLLGQERPLKLSETDDLIQSVAGRQRRIGKPQYFSYPTATYFEENNLKGRGFVEVFPGHQEDIVHAPVSETQPLSRVLGFAQAISSDMGVQVNEAVAYLLCDLKSYLPWMRVRVDKRKWTVGDESLLGVPDSPNLPPNPPSDRDLYFTITVGTPWVSAKSLADLYSRVKQEALNRFAGEQWAAVFVDQLIRPLGTDSSDESSVKPATIRRPRPESEETSQMVAHVEEGHSRGEPWGRIFDAWNETHDDRRYKDARSMQQSYYQAKRRRG